MKEEIIRLLDECEKNLSDVDFKHLSSYIGLYLSVSRMYSNYLRVGFSDISFKKLMKDLRTDLFKLSAIRRILEIDTHKYYPSLVSTFARKEIITKLLIID